MTGWTVLGQKISLKEKAEALGMAVFIWKSSWGALVQAWCLQVAYSSSCPGWNASKKGSGRGNS